MMSAPEDYARGAESVLKRGFTALKFDPVPGPWRTYVPKDHIRRAVKVIRAVRFEIFMPSTRQGEAAHGGFPRLAVAAQKSGLFATGMP
jgi:hypothetical protein